VASAKCSRKGSDRRNRLEIRAPIQQPSLFTTIAYDNPANRFFGLDSFVVFAHDSPSAAGYTEVLSRGPSDFSQAYLRAERII
jgi:hypothetical protein